ncbi:hypothetical protein [Muribaculum intestinale]|uniref:hypothetical protein n=1 Tax=Muribaculum intestinale TaxID=1796646 RepID=UPI0025B55787|nr:hypothetical protein [Muribaculum intestinale]
MWQVADATGWTVDYILNKVNYQTLIMMMNDAPRYIGHRKKSVPSDSTPEEDAAKVANFFRSNLKQ